MNSKFYVSYEAARLLKEKGYNEECDYCFYYDDYNDKWDFDYPHNLFDDDPMYYNNETIDDEMYSMPTKSEAIDWLERNGIIVIAYYCHGEWLYLVTPLLNEIEDKLIKKVFIRETYPTRLQAEDAAIIKALELLQ